MSKKKFNVGDKVKTIMGTLGKITAIDLNSPTPFVVHTDTGWIECDHTWIDLVEPTNLMKTPQKTSGGIKHDQAKPPMDLIPYEALEEIAKVLAAGEKKYGTANWTSGIEMRRLLSAAMRHIGQFNSGEDFDEETETLHLANAATNLMFAIWMYSHRPDLDNRWSKEIKHTPLIFSTADDDQRYDAASLQKRGR